MCLRLDGYVTKLRSIKTNHLCTTKIFRKTFEQCITKSSFDVKKEETHRQKK